MSKLEEALDALIEELEAPAKPMRVLFWDIETAPLLAHVWSAKTRYVGAHMFVHDSFLLCWAAKWADGSKVFDDVVTPDEVRAQDDRRVVVSMANMLREADVVVAHNGDRFDIPMLNNRLLQYGEEPLGPVKTIDTLKLAKKSFRLASNKLDYLAGFLNLGKKIDTDFQLWLDCYHGEPKALAEMLRYNRHDVRLLEQVFDRLAPHVKGLPRMVDASARHFVCPTCGSTALVPDGHYRTNASTFPRWRCTDCGRYARGRTADKRKKVTLHPL